VWKFKKINDFYVRIVAIRNLFIEFIHEVRSDSPLTECGKSLQYVKDLKGARLNGGVKIE